MAKIRQIEMDDEGDYPQAVTIQLTKDEALLVALLVGKLSFTSEREILPGVGDIHSHIYAAIVGKLFNVFWDDGVDEAKRNR